MVRDTGWAYKPISRNITLEIFQLPPQYTKSQLTEIQKQIDQATRLFRTGVRKSMRGLRSGVAVSIRRELELRDLNEDSLDKLNSSIVVFATASFVFQALVFAVLRKLAQDL